MLSRLLNGLLKLSSNPIFSKMKFFYHLVRFHSFLNAMPRSRNSNQQPDRAKSSSLSQTGFPSHSAWSFVWKPVSITDFFFYCIVAIIISQRDLFISQFISQFLSLHRKLHDTNLQFGFLRYKLAICIYKVRIVWYKLASCYSYEVTYEDFISCNSEGKKSELWD